MLYLAPRWSQYYLFVKKLYKSKCICTVVISTLTLQWTILLKSKTYKVYKIHYINKTHVWKNLFINKLHFYVLIIKSLYIIFIIKFVDLTCPLAKPERSRVQSLLKLSADTDPYCWPTAVLPKHHFNTCLGSACKRNRKEYI